MQGVRDAWLDTSSQAYAYLSLEGLETCCLSPFSGVLGVKVTERSGFEVQGMGFRVQGSGLRVQDSGFRVQGSGFGVQCLGFRVWESGFRVQGSGFRVQGLGFRVCGLGLCGCPTVEGSHKKLPPSPRTTVGS